MYPVILKLIITIVLSEFNFVNSMTPKTYINIVIPKPLNQKNISQILNATAYDRIRYSMQYVLYSNNPTRGEIFSHSDLEQYSPPKIVKNSPIKVIIPGNFPNTTDVDITKQNYISYNFLVLTVNWADVKSEILSELERTGPAHIAFCVYDMLMTVFEKIKITHKLHIIGHGYGGHVAGYVGRIFLEHGNAIQRITGLDISNPYIPNGLNKMDAEFVDVINTVIHGDVEAVIGHVDFYPNAKKNQPACDDIRDDKEMEECNSLQAFSYFATSVAEPHKYLASRCQNNIVSIDGCHGPTVYMGDSVDTSARGIYYMSTEIFKRVRLI